MLEENILKQLFLQQLPTNAQLILASTSQTTPIQQLAELADKIIEVAAPHQTQTLTCSAVSSAAPSSVQPSAHAQAMSGSGLHTLQAKVDELTQQVNALTCQLTSQQSSRRGTPLHPDPAHPLVAAAHGMPTKIAGTTGVTVLVLSDVSPHAVTNPINSSSSRETPMPATKGDKSPWH